MDEVEQVFADPAASYWLRDALRSALQRDPVDALGDAEWLVAVLRGRCDAVLGGLSAPTAERP